MSLKTYITDPATGRKACVMDGIYPHSLAVATRPMIVYDNAIKFFTNDTEGVNMNVNAGFSGTPEKIHDGTDSTLWTATDIVGGGKTTFNSADRNHTVAGALSIKVDNSPVGDVYQIAKGSPMNMPDYTALTMWINVDKDWKLGDVVEMHGWDTALGVQVGVAIDLKDYFAYLDYDVWHKLTIPLTDMGISGSTTLDSFRVEQVAKEGKSPKYYLDDVQLEEVGIPFRYELKADKSTWLHVDSLSIIVVARIPSTITGASMPYLSYNTLLGTTLISGLTYSRKKEDKTVLSLQIKNIADILELPQASITSLGSDGVDTFLKIDQVLTAPLILKPEEDDILSYTVNDDLSGLTRFRISAGCRIEYR